MAEKNIVTPGEKQEKRQEKKHAPKRTALICIAAVLLLLAISIPLTFIDYDALFLKISEKHGKEEIIYYPADYQSPIFENEEYRSHFGEDMTVKIKEDGFAEYAYPFTDMASAEEVAEKLQDYKNGAGVLGKYFYALLCGCDEPEEQKNFLGLFAEEYRKELPRSFPPQKVYNIRLEYCGDYEYEGEKTKRWRVSYEVVRNDGTVLNFSDSRDGGEAWFLVREGTEDADEIRMIAKIKYMN